MDNKITRRQFFKLKPYDMVNLIRTTDNTKEVFFLRPPGALKNEEQFLSTCERCHACSDACPYDVIQHFGPASGQSEKTPFINPSQTPCHWCKTMDCIQACPSGALTFGPEETVAPIGKAVLNRETCLTEEGILCDRCATTCPSHINAITMVERKPHLDKDLCVGCGLCVFYCESTPASLKIEALPSEEYPGTNGT